MLLESSIILNIILICYIIYNYFKELRLTRINSNILNNQLNLLKNNYIRTSRSRSP